MAESPKAYGMIAEFTTSAAVLHAAHVHSAGQGKAGDGKAFAVGMVVDNSIVILENIYRHRQMGKSLLDAAQEGASEVWGAVVASTLTTMAVFIPVVFIKEEVGQLFGDIALALATSVGLSLIVSITVIPCLSARLIHAAEVDESLRRLKALVEAGEIPTTGGQPAGRAHVERGDLPAALAQAKKEKKTVLIDFTGSDWCPPCKALNKEVFSTKEFADYAKDKFVLVELDFPRTKTQSPDLKKANQALSEKYRITGFPTVVLLNNDGKELWRKVGYMSGGSKEFLAEIEKALEGV